LAILLSPIGALPLKEAFITWTFLSFSLLLISILLLLRTYNFQKSKHLILPIILANIIFRPTTTTFLGGQFSIYFLYFCNFGSDPLASRPMVLGRLPNLLSHSQT